MSKINIDLKSKKLKKVLENYSKTNFKNYQIEQIALRVYICDKCFINDKCSFCNCKPADTIGEPFSCNKQKYFPDFLNEIDWKHYKIKHNIDVK